MFRFEYRGDVNAVEAGQFDLGNHHIRPQAPRRFRGGDPVRDHAHDPIPDPFQS